jgi:hypothetical protein
MGIETNYEYIYYTVIDTSDWILGNYEWFGEDGFTWVNAIDFINHKLKTSKDKSVNNYRVDYSQYWDDIDIWKRSRERYKQRPVFVQFQDNQTIQLTGEGDLFVLYEDDEDDDEVTIEQAINDSSYWNGPDSIDGLSGAGGRL